VFKQLVKKNPIVLQLEELRLSFSEKADPAKTEAMRAYMKGKFEYFGLQKPVRDLVVKPWIKELGILDWTELKGACTWLWEQEEREFQYVAMELLFKNKKQWTVDSLNYFEQLILKKSWWDTVDYIASTLVGFYFLKYPERINVVIEKWIKSKNMWLNRSAMIFQLKYRDRTDTGLLFRSILPHLESTEFFIQKAIGWSLRQHAYTDAALVKKFVDTNALKPLSKREALKHFDKE
jgi:3-methyladenine DNA glycosylase AlkD